MKPHVGDMVRVKDGDDLFAFYEGMIGLVTDTLEDETGFENIEVVFENDRGWFSDLQLEVINEAS